MSELPLLRYIPFRRIDIVRMCLSEGKLDEAQRAIYTRASALIEEHFHREFHGIKQELKEAYAPLDPDSDTRTAECAAGDGQENFANILATRLEQVLQRANYEQITPENLQAAFDSASLFHVRLIVEMEDFDEVLLYYRGTQQREEQTRPWFGIVPKTVRFTNYERVVLFLRVRDDVDTESTLGGCRPGSTMLKLFQNVPDADIEMLFPNTRVAMRLLDKLMIGIPALISGGAVFTTKVGATLVLLGSLLGFWLGVHSEPVSLDKGTVLALLAGLGALGGYFWKQFKSFKNRKLKYTQALTENLYFKLLDNNAGVLFRVLDEAEESECKESLLAFCFLLNAAEPQTMGQIDQAIESWLAQRWQCRINFEISDALEKLQELGLASCDGQLWQCTDPKGWDSKPG